MSPFQLIDFHSSLVDVWFINNRQRSEASLKCGRLIAISRGAAALDAS
jgi:hypothetical protein